MYYTSAGTQLAVSATLPETFDDDDVTGYPAETYTTVGEITAIPEHGAEVTLITHNPLAERVTGKRKGSINYGSVALVMALDPDDSGQAIMQDFADGENIDDSLAVQITLPTGHTRYFTAQVMSFQAGMPGTDEIMGATTNLEIDRRVVMVDPAP